MERGRDYDWSDTTTLQEKDIVCGFCGGDISTKTGYKGWVHNQSIPQYIYICHKCGEPNFFDAVNEQTPMFNTSPEHFSEEVKKISPRFVEIYTQAYKAESEDLDEIAGSGYGKALEVLVKDFLIKSKPGEEEDIKKMTLRDCIRDKVENPKIKALADKARVIRNDETHYERKYEESDIEDFKRLIKAAAAWIDLDSYTSQVMEDQ